MNKKTLINRLQIKDEKEIILISLLLVNSKEIYWLWINL